MFTSHLLLGILRIRLNQTQLMLQFCNTPILNSVEQKVLNFFSLFLKFKIVLNRSSVRQLIPRRLASKEHKAATKGRLLLTKLPAAATEECTSLSNRAGLAEHQRILQLPEGTRYLSLQLRVHSSSQTRATVLGENLRTSAGHFPERFQSSTRDRQTRHGSHYGSRREDF